ncbi:MULTISPECIES: TIR domain-containing protein [Vagococcus]|uniref:TIR domain-containing protein n=1 Tax=Vagococcus fluvialis bH819 TaxID=1255619 RepID=A0A1X6WLL0_9ENTE|nr:MULTISPECIES: TIR domain-containing protein [Vagococcus]SLM85157.1 hypothetical protein FM121_03600 [Vagococcus fluvialis bH819]HCM88430.1 TIR domain-containing protein [Vagococcus sp.]
MPGKTQRKYVGETMRIQKEMTQQLKQIAKVLPYEYNRNLLLEYYKEFYPTEWNKIIQRDSQHRAKDDFLKSNGKKKRYKSVEPEQFFFSHAKVKNIISKGAKEKHKSNFNQEERDRNYQSLKNKRLNKIKNQKDKLDKYNELTQEVTPDFIEILIASYHQKGISTEEKIEIVNEMKKYNCPRSLEFFYKLNDSEKNDQVRNIAFKHLQDSGNYVKLRKKFKGKQKDYMTEVSEFNMKPEDLVKRLEDGTVQSKKKFDIFISHSYKDKEVVKKVVSILNRKGYSCYFDWSSDSDFLKRKYVSDFTKEVLKYRLRQSKELLFIRSENSMKKDRIKSSWIKFELDYCVESAKKIMYMDLLNDDFELPYNKVNCDIINDEIDLINKDKQV